MPPTVIGPPLYTSFPTAYILGHYYARSILRWRDFVPTIGCLVNTWLPRKSSRPVETRETFAASDDDVVVVVVAARSSSLLRRDAFSTAFYFVAVVANVPIAYDRITGSFRHTLGSFPRAETASAARAAAAGLTCAHG